MKSKRIVLPLVSLLSIVLLASCATETSSTSATSSATSTTTAPETTTEQPSSTTADTTTTPPSSTTTTTTTDTPSSPTTTPTEPSTPIAVEWEVKLVPVTGVTLTLDRPDGKYEEGEIVTITARVTDEGKIFEGFESEQVDDIPHEKGLGETYTGTFIMPAGDVTITAKTTDRVQYKVTDVRLIGEMAQGWTASIKSGDTYYGGSEETLTIEGDGVYLGVETNVHVYVNGVYYATDYDNRNKCFEAEIVLPEEDAEILVIHTQNSFSSSGALVSLVESEHVQLLGFNPEFRYTGLTAYFRVDDGYQVGDYGSVQYRLDGGEWQTIAPYQYPTYLDWGKLTIGSFAQAKKVEIKIATQQKENADVQVTYEGLDQIAFESINESDPGIFDALPSSFPAETEITISGLAYTGDAEHYLQNVTVEGAYYSNYSSGKLNFRTGKDPIKISFVVTELVDIKFEYSQEDVLDARASVYDSSIYGQREITAACPGDSFQVDAKPAPGKIVSGVTIDGEEASFSSSMYNSTTGFYSFNGITMPEAEGSITIGFTVVNAYSITVTPPAGETIPGELSITGGVDKARQEGEKINFEFQPSASRFYATAITCVNIPELEIDFDPETQSGSFTMPAQDVELTFEYDEYENVDVEIAVDNPNIWPTISTENGDLIQDPGVVNFLVGDRLRINARFDSASEDAQTKDIAAFVYTTEKPEGEEIALSSYTYGNYGFELTIDKTVTKIELRAIDKKVFNVEVADETEGAVKLSYGIVEDYTSVPVDSLDGRLSIGTQFTIDVDDSAVPEGKLAVVKVIDVASGTEIEKDWEGYYTALGDIRIEISLQEIATVSWNAIGMDGSVAGTVTAQDVRYFFTDESTTSASVPSGSEVTIEVMYGHVQATITIDGASEVIDLDASDWEPKSHTFTATGNVTILFEVIE